MNGPMKRKYVVYRRVSTNRQFQSGLGLEAQSESVRRYLSTQPDAVVLADMIEAESGKNDERPILRQAVELCRKESATLLVSKIDRLCRSLRLIMMLEQYKVPFIAADNPEMNELVCHIMVALAQSERKTIATRVRDALRQAKIRGVKLGGPNIAEARLLANTARIQKAKEQNAKLRTVVVETVEKTGLTKLADIAQALNLRGIKTNRGSQFTPTQIHRLLKTNN
jgi:DNA invertase Pin-like site-specific DNA recombinase